MFLKSQNVFDLNAVAAERVVRVLINLHRFCKKFVMLLLAKTGSRMLSGLGFWFELGALGFIVTFIVTVIGAFPSDLASLLPSLVPYCMGVER